MLRSGDPLDQQWNTVNRHGAQGQFHKGEIISARDAVENRRARMLLGGSSGIDLYGPVEYDMTQSYAGKILVHLDATNNAVTSGTIDPISGLQVYSIAGWWLSCASGVPLAGNANSVQYHIPQFPYPGTPISNGNNYWYFIASDPQCY